MPLQVFSCPLTLQGRVLHVVSPASLQPGALSCLSDTAEKGPAVSTATLHALQSPLPLFSSLPCFSSDVDLKTECCLYTWPGRRVQPYLACSMQYRRGVVSIWSMFVFLTMLTLYPDSRLTGFALDTKTSGAYRRQLNSKRSLPVLKWVSESEYFER